jgi:hypothetical protein
VGDRYLLLLQLGRLQLETRFMSARSARELGTAVDLLQGTRGIQRLLAGT